MVSSKTLLTTTLATLATSAPLTTRSTTILPSTLSLWNSGSSQVSYNTGYGEVQRSTGTNYEFSTLTSFSGLSAYAGQNLQCQLIFELSNGASVSGSGNAQVFYDSKAAAPGATSDFRNNQLALLTNINVGGRATWNTPDGRVIGSSLQLPCDTLAAQPNLEVAPQGDRDGIYYPGTDGLKIEVLN